MPINYKPVKIRLISKDDNWEDTLKKVWKISRPQVDENNIDINEVLKIDTPIIDFPSFVIQFTVPVYLRDVLCSMREHVVWARTSRVEDVATDFDVAEVGSDARKYAEACFERLQEAKAVGETQDQYRRHLPLSYLTTFSTRMSFRSLVKLYKFIQELVETHANSDAREPILQMMFDLYFLFEEIGIDYEEVQASIMDIDICPDRTLEFKWPIEQGKQFTTINLEVSFSLRAQLIRHRMITVADEYGSILRSIDIVMRCFDDKVKLSAVASNEFWDVIVKKRNCWLAQSDMWYPIVSLFNHDDFKVPCDDQVCKYHGDCVQRLEGKDPGLPCPRHAVFTNTPLSASREELTDYAHASMRPMNQWADYILQATENQGE